MLDKSKAVPTVFLLQKERGKELAPDNAVVYDAIQCSQWMGRNTPFLMAALGEYDGGPNVIPVGSVEFVNDILERIYSHPKLSSINIPRQLDSPEYLLRRIWPNGDYKSVLALYQDEPHRKLYIKPAGCVKEFPCEEYDADRFENEFCDYKGSLFASAPLPCSISSEWRLFIENETILDVRPYFISDTWRFPDLGIVQKMVRAYNASPPAYTMDVAVLSNGATVLMEVHNFISCGLYGFEGSKILSMLRYGFRYELSQFSHMSKQDFPF